MRPTMTETTDKSRGARLEARISVEQKAVLQRAAMTAHSVPAAVRRLIVTCNSKPVRTQKRALPRPSS